MSKKYSAAVIHHTFRKMKRKKIKGGNVRILFRHWSHKQANGALVTLKDMANIDAWVQKGHEAIHLIEKGIGTAKLNGISYALRPGMIMKTFPNQGPIFYPKKTLSILTVSMPGSALRAKRAGENLRRLKLIDSKKIDDMVYEYEALAKEVIIPKYKNGLGLIQFTFPIDKIPLHIHPYSDRLIRTISGKGYTFAEPNLYEMTPDSFTAFPKGVTHTNGPVPGHIYRLWAFQIPWVPSEITKTNIAGHPHFVRYVGPTPPKKLWKTKPDFLRAIKKMKK